MEQKIPLWFRNNGVYTITLIVFLKLGIAVKQFDDQSNSIQNKRMIHE